MIKMQAVRNIQLQLSALSVFRGVMNRSVPYGFYRLLCSLDKAPEEFLSAYGSFVSLICERGCADRLAYSLTEAALFDENCFTRAAAGGKYESLSARTLDAVRCDCSAILAAAKLTSRQVLDAYRDPQAIADIRDSLPQWDCGEPAPEFEGFDGDLSSVAAYYRKNGCGMFARYKAFIWRDGDIRPVLNYDTIELDDFTGYERQREKVIANTRAFIEGRGCNNCLLFGDMGTGKSSTVKAVANAFRSEGLRIVEMPKERLMDFPLLVDKIAHLPLKFIIFIDDLSFQSQDQSYTALKAVLEGGLAARPANALIYATSNRRHLVKERLSDRSREVDDINTRDNMQETLSLSDRFGLAVCYTAPSKKEYLSIVFALARARGLDKTEEELADGAERFALAKGGRSPRCAGQYIESLYTDAGSRVSTIPRHADNI